MLDALLKNLLARDDTLPLASQGLLIESVGPPRAVAAGEALVRQGTRPTAATVIVTGWAGRYIALQNGRQQTVGLQFDGDFVDLHSFALKVMDHSVITLTPCTVAAMPYEALRRISETDPHLARALWLLTLIDAAMLRRLLLGSGQQPALERSAHLICELFTRLEAVGLAVENEPFRLPLSQGQLGEALGVSVVHMNRTLAELKARGLFHWSKGVARILDWRGLVALAEFDPSYLSLTREPR